MGTRPSGSILQQVEAVNCFGRIFVEMHYKACLSAGIKILCTNVILIVLSLLASSFEDFAFVLLLIGMSVVFYLISKFSSNNLVNNAK